MARFLNLETVERDGDSYLLIPLRPPHFSIEKAKLRLARLAPLLLYLLAALCAVLGNGLVAHAAKALWLTVGACLWLLAELVANRESLRAWHAGLDVSGKQLFKGRLLCAALGIRGLLLIVEWLAAESASPLLLESLLWLGAGAVGWLLLNRWYRSRAQQGGGVVVEAGAITVAPSLGDLPPRQAGRIPRTRVFWLALAVLSSLVVWQNTSGNQIQPVGMAMWFASALLWSMVFAPDGWSVVQWARSRLEAFRAYPQPSRRLVLLALLGIFALGASFRLTQIDTLPAEMLDADHRGPIVAAYEVSVGDWFIMMLDFQAQEPMHYYFIAAFARLTGAPIDHTMIKLVSVLASLPMLPIMFWLGVELAGRERRKLGLALGLMACALVAVSFWHVIITRYATRTHLTAPFAALTLVFLVRAMRDNRRSDFILLGLTLGYAWFSYAASRALPIAAATGIVLTLLARRMSWQERLRYLAHSAIAGCMFCVVALPYFHFAVDNPFYASWQVTTSVFNTLPGEAIEVDLEALANGLMTNYHTQLRTLNFDPVPGRTYQAHPYEPSLDPYSGAFLILGLVASCAQILRSPRDPVWWFLPLYILIMILPATMHIAYPIQVPSNTRTAGAMPVLYLLAALPVVTIACQLACRLPRRLGKLLAALFCIALVLLANQYNTRLYFDDIAEFVNGPVGWSKRHMGRTMNALAETGVPWGNLQIVHTRGFEFDSRNPYIEGAVPDPGFSSASTLPTLLRHLDNARYRSDRYRLDADKDLVFFYANFDEDTGTQLSQWFPTGYEVELRDAEYMLDSYMLYRVPALGAQKLDELIALGAQS